MAPKTILIIFNLFALVLLFSVAHQAQTPPACSTGEPRCYTDLEPYSGHGAASALPSSLCSNCAGDNRRVVVVRIDSSWDDSPSQTNAQIWNAVTCAVSGWNDARESNGASTGYYFVIDQSNQTSVTPADITITKGSAGGTAMTNGSLNAGSSTRKNTITMDPANTGYNASDVCGRVKHEMGHLMGLANYQPTEACNTIMRGSASDGSRPVNQIQPHDVSRVNAHFANRSNCTITSTSDTGKDPCEPVGSALGPDYYWDTQACAWATPTPTPSPALSCEEGCPNVQAYYPAQCFGSTDWCAYPDNGCPGDLQPNGRCCCVANTPILIDLSGDGFNLTDYANGVNFDLSAVGVGSPTSWTAANSDEAFLALDRNGNEVIDNGSELFGNATEQTQPVGVARNGFFALAEYDNPTNGGNGDGLIDHEDTVYGALRLWRDLDHNGICERTELSLLVDWKIDAISLDFKESRHRDRWGNGFRYRSKVIGNGTGRWAYDVLLQKSPR